MKNVFFSIVFLLSLSRTTWADIMFTISPSSQSVAQGATAFFDIFVQSTTGPVTVAGLETGVSAGNGLTDGAILPSSPITILNTGFFFPNFPLVGTAFGAVNQIGGTIVDGPQLFGKILLDTTGVATGTYSLVLDSELALNNANLPINIASPGASVQYTVTTAVPEPSSLGLVGLVSLVASSRRRMRRIR